MSSSRIAQHLLYPAAAGIAVVALLSALFLFQSRWLTGRIVERSSEQHVAALQDALYSAASREFDTVMSDLRAADNPESLLSTLNADSRNNLSTVELTDDAPSFLGWQDNDSLVLSASLKNDGRFVVARFVFEIDDTAEFRRDLISVEASGTALVFTVGGIALLALVVAVVVSIVLASERKLKRIAQLQAQAEKLRDSDFGEQLPVGRDGDELDELADVFNDMRDRLRATTLSRDYVDSILASMNDAIVVTGNDGSIKRINRATSELLNYANDELIGMPIDVIVNTKKSGSLCDEPASGQPREAFFRTRSGEDVPVSFTCSFLGGAEAESGDRIFSAQNITERRKAEKRIRYLARIDSLTKLPNRMQFQHLLQRSLARAKRNKRAVCLFYIDVDGFKDINDTFGHLAGDTTLETVADRLTAELPEGSVVGRLAGDEFAIILDDTDPLGERRTSLFKLARRVLDRLAEPMAVQGHEVFLTASMGVAAFPRDAENVIDLIRNADAALYSAKKSGGNVYAEYRPEMNEAAVERLMTKSRLKRAFERDELLVHYQPKYNTDTGEVIGAEALVRWELPGRGIILPSDFIPIAEESNLIIEIGEWVLDKVCEDFRYFQHSVSSPGRVSVNLSLKQLRQRNFVERIGGIMKGHEVSPTSLELEITETTLMENPEKTIKLLDELYALGLHLAIDDFGTGYSSLSALQQFPISTLKIDRSFVKNIAFNKDDATIVSTIVQMGRNLNLEIVAEGVETEDQLAFLQSLGCTHVQGLLFGDPMSADSYLELLLAQLEGTDAYRALFA